MRPFWQPWLLLLLTLALTLGVTASLWTVTREKDEARFVNVVQHAQDRINNRLETYVDALRGAAGLVTEVNNLDVVVFRRYIEHLKLQEHYPGIQGIGYSQRVRPSELDAFVAARRNELSKDFKIWPQFPRDEFHPIIYLEPLDRRNKAAIGYDMFTEPERRLAMERARDTGEAAATGKVTLVQEIDGRKQAGFLIYLPVYARNLPAETVEQRRHALRGFVYSPFRVDDLFKGIFGDATLSRLSVAVYDGTSIHDDARLHRMPLGDDRDYTPSFVTHSRLDVAGRPWTLAFATRPGFEFSSGRSFVPFIFFAGLFASLVIFVISRAQAGARAAAEQSAAELLESQDALRQSEKRHRSLVSATAQIVWNTAQDGSIVDDLPSWRTFTGQSIEQIMGQGWLDAVHPGDRARLSATISGSLKDGKPHEVEFQLRDRDGVYRHMISRAAPVQEDDGRVRELIGICTDITERKRVEEERARWLAHEQSARARAESAQKRAAFLAEAGSVLASSMDYEKALARVAEMAIPPLADWCIIHLVSDDGSLRQIAVAHRDPQKVSLAWELERRYPFPKDAPLGAPHVVHTRMSELHREVGGESIAAFAREPEHVRLISELGFKSAIIVPLVARSKTVGAMTFAIAESTHRYTEEDLGLAEDLAHRAALAIDNARLYREAEDARKAAESANRAKDEFLATLSHELRTPLTPILGWVRMLRGGKLDEATTFHGVSVIERNVKAQAQLIEDLLDVSRIITGKLHLNLRTVDLITVVQSALDAVAPAADAKSIQIKRHFNTPESAFVRGDPDRLQQIAWNLFTNAIKFTQNKGSIDVSVETRGGQVLFKVADNGEGIAPEFVPHVFDRFKQADSTSTRAHGGLGLGLAIVRHMVELHGGSVAAASDGKGKGATFTVTLPADTAPSIKAASVAVHAEPKSQVQLNGLDLLVVDDEKDARDLISFALQECGANVKVADSAGAALALLEDDKIDLLISDVGMPGEDGYSLMQKVRLQTSIPAIALTAFARDEDRARALSAGFNLHLSKPVEPLDLTMAVARLAGRI